MALALVAALGPAVMATDQSQYQKVVGKYAVTPDSNKGTTACLCGGDSQVGWLTQGATSGSGQIGVECCLPSFDGNGNLVAEGCCINFSTIAR